MSLLVAVIGGVVLAAVLTVALTRRHPPATVGSLERSARKLDADGGRGSDLRSKLRATLEGSGRQARR